MRTVCSQNPGIALALSLLAALICASAAATDSSESAKNPAVAAAEGLWEYTGLVTRDGQSLPLTGVFLISREFFLQQSIFNGEPFAEQAAMAHTGPYWGGGAGLRLQSDQTLSIDPTATTPLADAGAKQHDLAVTREGDRLTLVFGGGTSTVQTFRRLGDGQDTQLFRFADGALAFTDGYFILVIGNARRAVTGYGTYDKDDQRLILNAVRWSASDGTGAINLRDTAIPTVFDGETLMLPGGQRFVVVN